jgi:AraC family transcriptional regulator of arabinose operon
LLLIVKTPALFLLQDDLIEVEANSAVLYSKGTPQWYGNRDREYSDDWVRFALDESDREFFDGLGILMNRAVALGDSLPFSRFIRDIGYEMYSGNPRSNVSTELYLKLLLVKISEKALGETAAKRSPHYSEFLSLKSRIQNDPGQEWNIDDMAKSLFLSRSHFQHLYKEIFGIGVTSDIIRCRVEHAQYLLFSTSDQISNIAESLGYKSVVHFARQFKEIVGMTPTEYRRLQGLSRQPYVFSANIEYTPSFDPDGKDEENKE